MCLLGAAYYADYRSTQVCIRWHRDTHNTATQQRERRGEEREYIHVYRGRVRNTSARQCFIKRRGRGKFPIIYYALVYVCLRARARVD